LRLKELPIDLTKRTDSAFLHLPSPLKPWLKRRWAFWLSALRAAKKSAYF